MRVGHEDRRCARRRELPDRAAGPRDREIGRGKRLPEPLRRRQQHVVRPADSRSESREVPLAGDVQDSRAAFSVRVHGEFVEGLRACEPAEHGDHGAVRRQAEYGPARSALRTQVVRGNGPADDAVLRAVPARDLVGEEDAAHERRGEAVRETEMRIGLGQRSRDTLHARSEDHRPGDEPSTTEHDVGRATSQDAQAREGRSHCAREGADELDPNLRGKPETTNVSSSNPASGTSRDSTRSGDPAKVTFTPRSRSASATARAGRT